MFYGTLSMLFCICSLLALYLYKRRSNRLHQNRILRNTRSAAPTTRRMGMENIPSTGRLRQIRPMAPAEENVLEAPPPPYTPSTTVAEEENIPLAPLPPPYTPSTIHTEREEENMPLTPPPAYIP